MKLFRLKGDWTSRDRAAWWEATSRQGQWLYCCILPVL